MPIMSLVADSQMLSHHAAVINEFNYSVMELKNLSLQNWQVTIVEHGVRERTD